MEDGWSAYSRAGTMATSHADTIGMTIHAAKLGRPSMKPVLLSGLNWANTTSERAPRKGRTNPPIHLCPRPIQPRPERMTSGEHIRSTTNSRNSNTSSGAPSRNAGTFNAASARNTPSGKSSKSAALRGLSTGSEARALAMGFTARLYAGASLTKPADLTPGPFPKAKGKGSSRWQAVAWQSDVC